MKNYSQVDAVPSVMVGCHELVRTNPTRTGSSCVTTGRLRATSLTSAIINFMLRGRHRETTEKVACIRCAPSLGIKFQRSFI